MSLMVSKSSPLVLAILDGWGFSKNPVGNAIVQGGTPVLDQLRSDYPFALLQASSLAVGMDWGETGNSEVGHLTIGAGRIVEQYLLRINRAIKDSSFFSNPALQGAFEHAEQHNSRVHIAGLLTSGSVHASFDHLIALIKLASSHPETQVFLHLFLDGKDSGLTEGAGLIEKLQTEVAKVPTMTLATIIGRNFAMDRDNNWTATEKAFNLIVHGDGEKTQSIHEKIQADYQSGLNDSTIPPTVIADYTGMTEHDALIFFNFREDSMRQITRSFIVEDEPFTYFSRTLPAGIYLSTMTPYIEHPQAHVAFRLPEIKNALAELFEQHGFHQLHIAESEKYAHITYFFNGVSDREFKGETDIFIKSDKSSPRMSAQEITDKVLEELGRDFYECIIINFANADVMAHEGDLEKAKQGAACVDSMIGRIRDAVLAKNGTLIITADHGNAESMTYQGTGERETKHNLNPVPLYIVAKHLGRSRDQAQAEYEESQIVGLLADVAPTILDIMGIEKPVEMTGQSLLGELGIQKP